MGAFSGIAKGLVTNVANKAVEKMVNSIVNRQLKGKNMDEEGHKVLRRPLSRHLDAGATGQDYVLLRRSYARSGHDRLFPEEYTIPLWSANVFPHVTAAAVETMRQRTRPSENRDCLLLMIVRG